MSAPRARHTATTLANGKVLVASDSAELYDSASGRWTQTLQVTHLAGQTMTCDPLVAHLIRRRGVPAVEVFRDLPQAESQVSLSNGHPGLRRAKVEVNGRPFRLDGLRDGESRLLNVANAMHRGTDNTILITANGERDSSAGVVISD
jgi:hypothetical protein